MKAKINKNKPVNLSELQAKVMISPEGKIYLDFKNHDLELLTEAISKQLHIEKNIALEAAKRIKESLVPLTEGDFSRLVTDAENSSIIQNMIRDNLIQLTVDENGNFVLNCK